MVVVRAEARLLPGFASCRSCPCIQPAPSCLLGVQSPSWEFTFAGAVPLCLPCRCTAGVQCSTHALTLSPSPSCSLLFPHRWLPSRSRDCSPAGSPRGHFDTAASVFAAGPGSPVTPQACHAGAGAACPVLAGGFGEQLQQLAAGRQAGSNAAPQVLCLRKARSLLSPMLSRPVRAASAPDGLSCHGLAAAAGWASGQQGQQCMGASWAQPPTRTVKMRGPQCGRAGQASAVQWA